MKTIFSSKIKAADIYILLVPNLINNNKLLKFNIPPSLMSNMNSSAKYQALKHYIDDKILIIIDAGKQKDINTLSIINMTNNCFKKLGNINNKILQFFLFTNNDFLLTQQVILFLSNFYKFDKYITNNSKNIPKEVIFYCKNKKVGKYFSNGQIISNNIKIVRDLGNEPSNKLTPKVMANIFKQNIKVPNIKIRILNKSQIKKLGMGGVIAVSQGSTCNPRFVIIKYCPLKNEKNIVLVGKGVTFDSGGISLKQGNFGDMKIDMIGGAVVFGIINSIAEMKEKINLIGLIPLVENMPDGKSYKPGDIITSYNKKTIEILNTDAEGRIILADALAYTEKFNPKLILDFASLTGQVERIFDNGTSVVISNNIKMCRRLIKAGERVHERLWELPMWEEYVESTKSTIADYKNDGCGKNLSTIFGGAFLSNFVPKNVPWCHIDLGKNVYNEDNPLYLQKGATGVGVQMGINFLLNY